MISDGALREQQSALRTLANIQEEAATTLTTEYLNNLIRGEVPPELALDILHAARSHNSPNTKGLLDNYETSLSKDDPLATYRPTLYGGNPQEGRAVFFDKAEVSCLRCHTRDGRGGQEVGPDLTGLGERVSREHILEAIVAPNAAIAEGYESVILYTKNGEQYARHIVKEDNKRVELEIP